MELLRDYAVQGRELEGLALFDFILTTHEGPRRRRDGLVFVPYLADSYKRDKGRLIRASREEVVPEVFGGWPPALQNIADNDLYEASMLLLLTPGGIWRISRVVIICLPKCLEHSKVQ